MLTEEIDLTFCGGEGDEPSKKKQKTVVDYSEIEDLARRMKNLLGGFGSGKYGSSTEDIEDLVRRMKNLNPKFTIPCMLVEKNQSEKEPECQQATLLAHLMRDLVVKGFTESNYSTNEEGVLAGETEGREEKGFYVGVEDDKAAVEAYFQTDIQDDGLTDIWEEMTIALEHSKDITEDSSSSKHASESGVNCVHSFILEDDLGYVCCICGVIERGIETVFDYPYPKCHHVENNLEQPFIQTMYKIDEIDQDVFKEFEA